MNDRAIDRYRIKAEIQYESAPLPVHLIATNTDDHSTAETWLTAESLSAHLDHYCHCDPIIVKAWIQELKDYSYTDFGSPQPYSVKGAATNRAVFNSDELIPFGFSASEMRPYRDVSVV